MAVNNCVKYLLFFFNLLFWVSPSCCLLLLPAAVLLGLTRRSLRVSPPFAGQNQALTGWLLKPESVSQKC